MIREQPLLSICIPTYNRSAYLKDALQNIISDVAFDERVEIVISDNASTDDTSQVCNAYVSKYDNIFYYRNEHNVNDENFYLVLQRAKGRYIRLFNDTLRFKPNALSLMLSMIGVADDANPLFFFQNNNFHSNRSFHISNLQKFVDCTSFYITWIANFGIWKDMFQTIVDPNKYVSLQLVQVDWFLQLASKSNSINIHYMDLFDSVSPTKKGGYDIFKVFIDNYFTIIRMYLKNTFYNTIVFQKEKYRLFKYFLIPWYSLLRIKKDDNYTFSCDDVDKIIFNEYKYSIYYYIYILYLRLKVHRLS